MQHGICCDVSLLERVELLRWLDVRKGTAMSGMRAWRLTHRFFIGLRGFWSLR